VSQNITAKVMTLTTGGSEQSGAGRRNEGGQKKSGLELDANGNTRFESFLGGHNFEADSPHDAPPPTTPDGEPLQLFTQLPWTEDDLDIVQGVLSDDGSGLRRFSLRLKYRAFNAQFETSNWLNMHRRLCESLSSACNELDDKVEGDVEIRISGYDYVDMQGDADAPYPQAQDDTCLNVSKEWIIASHKILTEGWKVYDIETEYRRLGVPNDKFRLTKINSDFAFSPTYPNLWCVPKTVTDKQLEKAGKHRSKCRMPVLTWMHPTTKATISRYEPPPPPTRSLTNFLRRCSQPMVGIAGHRNAEDENLVEQYRLMSGDAKRAAKLPLVIIDARPKVNAQVNQAAGKGFELSKFYANTEVREGSAGPRRSAQRRRVFSAAEAGKRGERERSEHRGGLSFLRRKQASEGGALSSTEACKRVGRFFLRRRRAVEGGAPCCDGAGNRGGRLGGGGRASEGGSPATKITNQFTLANSFASLSRSCCS
jgi:hypothetical protein